MISFCKESAAHDKIINSVRLVCADGSLDGGLNSNKGSWLAFCYIIACVINKISTKWYDSKWWKFNSRAFKSSRLVHIVTRAPWRRSRPCQEPWPPGSRPRPPQGDWGLRRSQSRPPIFFQLKSRSRIGGTHCQGKMEVSASVSRTCGGYWAWCSSASPTAPARHWPSGALVVNPH